LVVDVAAEDDGVPGVQAVEFVDRSKLDAIPSLPRDGPDPFGHALGGAVPTRIGHQNDMRIRQVDPGVDQHPV
jgi:hypothetical protein